MDYTWMPAYDAVVVGTGAAGYSAACRIREQGRSVAIVTEGVNRGTSRNTGSDKQTYYKLGLGGSAPDSVRAMAQTLFDGGCVDGDNALCEAALSARCFHRLCELGVPFPHNRYGEFVGYKTDHDPFARATSAGPLTSKFMTQALEREAARLQIPVYDGLLAVEVVRDGDGVCGVLCLEQHTGRLLGFPCAHAVLATGGPAGIYRDTVYPACHNGSTGLALKAGARLQNMTQWQYGLASTQPRWNVSGTYMQVLPRFVSVDDRDVEREFLAEAFSDPYAALNAVFLKGYQWPFDVRKARQGSSYIDLLVYRESVLRGRKVYLDFTANPFGLEQIDFSGLSDEAHGYLRGAGACFGTPIARLEKMNAPAIELYRSKGVDLAVQWLPVALCAQHNNGGIAVDHWWQTTVPGLYAVGECAGTHGVFRPGGSALNAGQVGALRAAQHIGASRRRPEREPAALVIAARRQAPFFRQGTEAPDALLAQARADMSACAGAIRSPEGLRQLAARRQAQLKDFPQALGVADAKEAWRLYRLHDTLLVQQAVAQAMLDEFARLGASRGSALYTDPDGAAPGELEALFQFREAAPGSGGAQIQQLIPREDGVQVIWRGVRPIPPEDTVFETVWRGYRENGNVF